MTAAAQQLSLLDQPPVYVPLPAPKSKPRKQSVRDHIAPAPRSELEEKLIAIAVEMLHAAGDYGVIVGEVVQEAERRGIKVGGEKMEDPMKQQRQTSWLARLMPTAGGLPRGDKRRSPLRRHHGKEQLIYVERKPEIEPETLG